MSFQVQPLQIGTGPGSKTVYIVTRVVGRHNGIEQAPDEIGWINMAVEWAEKRWYMAPGNVRVLGHEWITIEDEI